MGWTSCHRWSSTAQAIEDESRPSAEWEIVWRSGNSFIYHKKNTNYYAHTYFLTSRVDGDIAVKDIGDFRTVAAAKKFLSLTENAVEEHKYSRKMAEELVEFDKNQSRVKGLAKGDKVYVRDGYTYCGWAEILWWTKGNRSMIVEFPNHFRPVRITKEMVDIDKTFEGKA